MAYTWIPFYKELSHKLLQFRNNRKPLIDWIYSNINSEYIKHFKDAPDGRRVADTDPFTVFAIFNRGIAHDKRVEICQLFKDYLNVSASVPKDFDGIPIMNAQQSNFMAFANRRKVGDIERLWNVFEDAVLGKDIEKSYNALEHQYLVKFNLTFGLFWIRPDLYLPLDSRSQNLLDSIGITFDNTKFLIYKGYRDVMNRLDEKMQTESLGFTNYAEFSYAAFLKTSKKQETEKNDSNAIAYWIYAPGEQAVFWDEYYQDGIMGLGWNKIGDLNNYRKQQDLIAPLKQHYGAETSQKNSADMLYSFAYEMKPGDIVFAKKGRSIIVGRGVVTSDYYYDGNREKHPHLRKVKWTHKGEWKTDSMLAMKTLTNITRYTDDVKQLNKLIEGKALPTPAESTGKQYWWLTREPFVDDEELTEEFPPYSDEDFLKEVFMKKEDYEQLKSLLLRKKNLILQGAPGVGKTFAAKRLAFSIIGEKNKDRVKMVQFHQNYSYEDFVLGYKPNENGGFDLKEGIFYQFCKKAAADKEHPYFFIIDEINRGNLSKIFGELLMMIEKDYRDTTMQMSYADKRLAVPSNVYLIGMMNTADRSLAMIDYALRRRFSFYEMKPAFDNPNFKEEIKKQTAPHLNELVKALEKLNEVIANDDSLGTGFCIGHSYLCDLGEKNDLESIVEYDIIPMLREYWFDNNERFNIETRKLREAVK